MAQKTVGYVHLEWVCPNCSTRNTGLQKVCKACGAPQPQDVVFVQPEKQELIKDEAAIAQAKKGADIHCPFCNARNSADAKVCIQCGGDLVGGVRRESGKVVGAFSSQPKPVGKIACPHCGTENPDTNINCSSCGGILRTSTVAPTPTEAVPAQKAKSGLSTGCIIAAVIGAIVIFVIFLVIILSFALKKEEKKAVVQDVSWERVIEIQALTDVEKSDWYDEIPSNAQIGECTDKFYTEQDQPTAKSTEVCGTPYTIDTGTGVGEVVQDCVYEVYAEYCDYTIEDWTVVDQVTSQGSDMDPYWPEYSLASNQREGESNERYTIVFEASGETYKYYTSDYDTFIRCTPGSEWILSIDAMGDVVDITQD